MDLKQVVRDFPDFPHEGILFRDIAPILQNPAHFNEAITQMEQMLADVDYDIIIAPESRGFIFSAPIAARQNKSLVPARKKGKLPGEVVSKTYALEYGSDTIEIHKDAIKPGQRVIIIDDLLATGGTAKVICDIVEEMDGKVACALFLIELCDIHGRDVLKGYDVRTILQY